MDMAGRFFPIDIQTFSEIVERKVVYIDKTEYLNLAKNGKCYLITYSANGRHLVKVGVSFDNDLRTIGEWKVYE